MKRLGLQSGFTLIEIIIAIVVIGFSIVAVTAAFSASALNSGQAMSRQQALQIGHAYLQDALSLPFQDNHPPVGKEATRNAYDNVADYHGDAYATITDRTNAAVPGLAGYSASFVVTNENIGPDAVNALRVDVTVRSPDGSTTVVTGYRTNHP